MGFRACSVWATWKVIDSSGTVIGTANRWNGNNSYVLAAGDYRFRLEATNAATGAYRLSMRTVN